MTRNNGIYVVNGTFDLQCVVRVRVRLFLQGSRSHSNGEYKLYRNHVTPFPLPLPGRQLPMVTRNSPACQYKMAVLVLAVLGLASASPNAPYSEYSWLFNCSEAVPYAHNVILEPIPGTNKLAAAFQAGSTEGWRASSFNAT